MHITDFSIRMFHKLIVLLVYILLYIIFYDSYAKLAGEISQLDCNDPPILCWYYIIICLMLSGTYYAKNYAGIISMCLIISNIMALTWQTM